MAGVTPPPENDFPDDSRENMSPAARHGRSGAFAFVDSQVATHRWRANPRLSPSSARTSYDLKRPNNPASRWLPDHCTAPIESSHDHPGQFSRAANCRWSSPSSQSWPACFWSALQPAKARTRRAACLSNLRNLQLAGLACARANNDTLLPNAMGTDAGGRRKPPGAADRAGNGARVGDQRPRRLILI